MTSESDNLEGVILSARLHLEEREYDKFGSTLTDFLVSQLNQSERLRDEVSCMLVCRTGGPSILVPEVRGIRRLRYYLGGQRDINEAISDVVPSINVDTERLEGKLKKFHAQIDNISLGKIGKGDACVRYFEILTNNEFLVNGEKQLVYEEVGSKYFDLLRKYSIAFDILNDGLRNLKNYLSQKPKIWITRGHKRGWENRANELRELVRERREGVKVSYENLVIFVENARCERLKMVSISDVPEYGRVKDEIDGMNPNPKVRATREGDKYILVITPDAGKKLYDKDDPKLSKPPFSLYVDCKYGLGSHLTVWFNLYEEGDEPIIPYRFTEETPDRICIEFTLRFDDKTKYESFNLDMTYKNPGLKEMRQKEFRLAGEEGKLISHTENQ